MDHGDMDMGGSDGGMDMGGPAAHPCKISMLFNFETIDACFLADSWQITSKGHFAGSCIGVILLTMTLEFLRRSVKSYDRYLIRKHEAKYVGAADVPAAADSGSDTAKNGNSSAAACTPMTSIPPFRPSIFEQAVRALLHMVQFAVAYIIMLLAMYFNVYIIICIFIGAFLGAFAFHWENLTNGGRQTTSAAREVTVCCA
ncbi:Ctr-domain-containing protein [Sarocladium strictum]